MHQKRLTQYFDLAPSPCTRPASDAEEGENRQERRRRRKSAAVERGLRQTVLDAGQKRIGLHHCEQCGMVYCVDEKRDVRQHDAYHNRFTTTKAFRVSASQLSRWREQLAYEDSDAAVDAPAAGLLFCLNADSNASLKGKFEELVKSFVNEELGYCPDLPVWDASKKRQALVFVHFEAPATLTKSPSSSNNSAARQEQTAFIAGLVLVDKVNIVLLMPRRKAFKGDFLGVNRIWVHSRLRRCGLATYLLDAARRLLVSGGVMPRSRVAFSEPTEAGIRLAVSYLNNDHQRQSNSAEESQRPTHDEGEGKENTAPAQNYLVYSLKMSEEAETSQGRSS